MSGVQDVGARVEELLAALRSGAARTPARPPRNWSGCWSACTATG